MSETFCSVCGSAKPYTSRLCAECADEKIEHLEKEKRGIHRRLQVCRRMRDTLRERVRELRARLIGEEASMRACSEHRETLRSTLASSEERVKELGVELDLHEDEAIHNEGLMVALREGFLEAKERVKELERSPPADTVCLLPARPEVVVLCGSSRFVAEMAVIAWCFERDEGKITMGLHLLPANYSEDPIPDHLAEHEGVAEKMDELHWRKIDLADRVFVVNPGGYIGDSTRAEIKYAERTGKRVNYLEAPEEQTDG